MKVYYYLNRKCITANELASLLSTSTDVAMRIIDDFNKLVRMGPTYCSLTQKPIMLVRKGEELKDSAKKRCLFFSRSKSIKVDEDTYLIMYEDVKPLRDCLLEKMLNNPYPNVPQHLDLFEELRQALS